MTQTTSASDSYNRGTRHIIIALFEYLLMLFIIMEFNTAYTEYERLKPILFYGTVFITIFLLLLRKIPFKLDGLLLVFLIGSLLPLLNVSAGGVNRFIKLYWLVAPLFILYLSSLRRISFDCLVSFLMKYSNLVLVLATISLIYWILGSNLHVISPTMYVPNTWKDKGIELIPTYHYLYFETQLSSFMGYETVRNSGIFNEGPMHNMILCVAISMELFLRKSKFIMGIFILGVTIATTFTTTGFIFLGLITAWIVYTFFSNRARFWSYIILSIIVVGTVSYSSTVLEDKETSSGEGSLRSRTNDILTCIEIGMKNPVLGQGLFPKKLSEADGGTYGYSNSTFTLFADGGFYTLFLYVATLLLIPLRDFLQERNNYWPLLMFSFFLLFTFTISQYKLLTLLFVSLGLVMFPRIDSQNANVVDDSINCDSSLDFQSIDGHAKIS